MEVFCRTGLYNQRNFHYRQAGAMKREDVRRRIEEFGILPGVRVSDAKLALFAVETVHKAGIPIAEITLTVPGAVDVIHQLTSKHADFVIGAGTVLDAEMAKKCVDAGARFLTSPGLIPEVVEFAIKNEVAIIPGALTPSEVITAWKMGVDFVKIFPCSLVGGSKYIQALKVPMPHIPLIASGGVNQSTAAGFILAGASAIGIRSELFPHEALHMHQDKWIRELARRYMAIVRDTRAEMAN